MNEFLIIAALLDAALLTGNEFAVGAFIHPAFNRLPDAAHGYAAREVGRTYGAVMPFWMISVVILSLLPAFVFTNLYSQTWWLFLTSGILYAATIVFSVLGPVPINNQIVNWQPENLPENWRELRRRWDELHFIRIVLLISGFVFLTLAVVSLGGGKN